MESLKENNCVHCGSKTNLLIRMKLKENSFWHYLKQQLSWFLWGRDSMNNQKSHAIDFLKLLAKVVSVVTLAACRSTLPTTEPLTTEEIIPKKVYMTMYASRSVNYRLGPSTEFKKIGTLNRGDAVRIVEGNWRF